MRVPLVSFLVIFWLNVFTQDAHHASITPGSIGDISLCTSMESYSQRWLSDSSVQGDGFMDWWRWYEDGAGKVRAQVSMDDSLTLTQLETLSPVYQTSSGISVGNSLADLMGACDTLYLTQIITEYEDLFFFEQYAHSRIEYRVDAAYWRELSGFLEMDEWLLVGGNARLMEYLESSGEGLFIISIRVVNVSGCFR